MKRRTFFSAMAATIAAACGVKAAAPRYRDLVETGTAAGTWPRAASRVHSLYSFDTIESLRGPHPPIVYTAMTFARTDVRNGEATTMAITREEFMQAIKGKQLKVVGDATHT